MTDTYDANLISTLRRATGLDEILAVLLIERGIKTASEAKAFLYPELDDMCSPTVFNGMEEGASLVEKHVAKGSKILIFGDYDCDGIGASSILYLTLKELNANVEVFIPTRVEDGYGLSLDTLKRVIASKSPNLIITVDCGIGSIEEVDYAKSQGIDILITDHHEPGDILPNTIVIDPKTQEGAPELCGAGVAYKLAEMLTDRVSVRKYLDICAISTIADLVPLKGENRIIARHGLKMLTGLKVRDGIKALLRLAGHKTDAPVTATDVGFKIAPRLNASGRLSSADKSFKLLTSTDSSLLNIIAEELDSENKVRQDLCAKTIEEAREMLLNYDLVNNKIIVLSNDEWEGGVIGIAAAKLTEDFKRPTILFTKKDDYLKGSCRSIDGVNIFEVLSASQSAVIQFGGHAMAAGLSIYPENLEKFIELANNYIKNTYSDELFLPKYRCDAILDIDKIDLDFVDKLKLLEPFGMDNPRPTFAINANALNFERISSSQHIKYRHRYNVEIIAFNAYDKIDVLRSDMNKRIYFSVEKDVFRNKESVKCAFKDMELMEIKPSLESLAVQHADKYLAITTEQKPRRKDSENSSLYGKILIAETLETFNALRAQYPTYVPQYKEIGSPNPYNTIILAPNNNCDFSYATEIVVYDYPPQSYLDFLSRTTGAVIRKGSRVAISKKPDLSISRNELISMFTFMRAYMNDREFTSVKDAYEAMLRQGYRGSLLTFALGVIIFSELGLFTINADKHLIVGNDKVNLEDSPCYKAFGV